MKKIIYTILMFMPLALFTSCYEDIEGDEIVYDIDFDKLFPDKKEMQGYGSYSYAYTIGIQFVDENGRNILNDFMIPDNNLNVPSSPAYYIKKTPKYYVNGHPIDYIASYRSFSGYNDGYDRRADFLYINKYGNQLRPTLSTFTVGFLYYFGALESINYDINRVWEMEIHLNIPELFKDENDHILRYTLELGNYRDNPNAPSSIKNITLDGTPLELLDVTEEYEYIVKVVIQ